MPHKLGDCFLYKAKSSSSPTRHLYVIVAELPPPSGNWIAVNVSSEGSETCCLLDGTDHPFLSKLSRVRYEYAMPISPRMLADHLRANPSHAQPAVSPATLERIQLCAAKSYLIKPFILEAIQACIPECGDEAEE